MADHSLSTRVVLSDGGSSGYGSVAAPTADEISNAQAAIDAFNAVGDTDSLLTAVVTVFLVPQSFFDANNWSAAGKTAWGFTPVAGKSFVNNGIGSPKQQYALVHELFHTVDSAKGVINHAKRATIGALMRPAPDQSVAGWWGAGYWAAPNENAADAFPQAYGVTGDLAGSSYTRPIPSASFGAFRTAIGGAGGPASTTLAANVSAGAANIKVAAVTGFNVGDWLLINGVERHQIATVGTSGSGGTGLTLDGPLTGSYTSGQSVVETSAPSDTSSGTLVIPVTRTTANGQVVSYTVTGLAIATSGKAKIRFNDGQEWGPYSDAAIVSLGGGSHLEQLTVTPNTLTPDFHVVMAGGNGGDVIALYDIIVHQTSLSGPPLVVWDTTVDVDPSLALRVLSIPYGGSPLSWGQSYDWTIIVGTAQAQVLLAPIMAFTPTVAAGATITYSGNALDLTYKIDTQTPTFRLKHPSGVSIDQAQLQLWNDAGSAILWDSGVLTFTSAVHHDVTIPAGYLPWGYQPRLSGAVRATGDTAIGVMSEKAQVRINAAPGAPYPVTVTSDVGMVVQRPDGVWVTTDSTPDLHFPFRDVDVDLGYTEDPVRQEVEVRDPALAPFAASPYIDLSSPSETFTSPTLDLEETYDFRADYDDTANVRSDWSARAYVKYSVAPTLTAVTPADNATVTDPTETIAWTYSSGGGKPMAGYELVGLIDGGVFYDSGFISGVAASADFPPFTLPNAMLITWQLTVYDNDGLFATIVRNFTTSFTQPNAPTGLTVTPDLDRMALLVAWDESALPDEEFYSYTVSAKSGDGQFRIIATLYDKTTTSLYYRAAALNRETIVYLTQSNGWTESDPAVVSATLGGEDDARIHGYWDVGADGAHELKFIKHGPGDTRALIEQFNPPGRPDKVILTWGATAYEGSFSLFTTDREQIRRLRRYKDNGTVRLFKTPYGSSRYVRYLGVPDTDEPVGFIGAAVSYISVDPSAADF